MDQATSLVKAKKVRLQVQGRILIDSLSLQLARGQRIGLTGRSGLGKTMFLDAVMRRAVGDQTPMVVAGQIEVAARQIGYSPQRSGIPPWFRIGALFRRVLHRTPEARRSDTEELGRKLRLPALFGAHLRTLSGGETQRVSLALALALADDLVVLDEPLTALDTATKIEVMAATRGFLVRHSIALLLVSHDPDVLLSLTDVVHVLKRSGPASIVEVNPDREESGDLDFASPGMTLARGRLLAAFDEMPP